MMPHKFILDYLKPKQPLVKKIFENYAVYIEDKIFLTTRRNLKKPCDDGIWVGTSTDYHQSLREQFPSLTNLNLYNIKKWLFLPAKAQDFEKTAIQLCELIKSGDPRIGVSPVKK